MSGKRHRLTVALAHRQAMLAAAVVAAEVRGEAEGHGACSDAWYRCADRIARRLVDLADKVPSVAATFTTSENG